MLCLFVLTILPNAAAANVIPIPGTRVSLEAPEGFELATQFPGVQSAEKSSSIMVSELPAPFEATTAGFTRDRLLSGGMTLRSSEKATVGGRAGLLLSVTQVVNGAIFEKWMAAVGSPSATVLVVATYPQTLAAELRDPMRASVLSATWSPGRGRSLRGPHVPDPGVGAAQDPEPDAELTAARSPRPSAAASAAEPFAIVGSSHSPFRVDDVELFAKQRITQTAQISDLTEIRGEPRAIAEKPAYEITAKAKDLRSGIPLSVYQMLVVDGDTYYIVQGMVHEDDFHDYLPEFRHLAESLEIH